MDTMEKQNILLQQYLTTVRNSLSIKPEGKLLICKNRKHDQYYYKPASRDTRRIYIPKTNVSLITSLAQKDYDLRFLQTAKKLALETEELINCGLLRDIHDLYQALAQVYQNLSDSRKSLVSPYVLPDDLFVEKWKKVSYMGKSFSDNSPRLLTENGERVRSKSEKIIADKLRILGIPYRYECPLRTRLLGQVFCDFTLLDVWNREEVILEHFGLLSKENYRDETVLKITAYSHEGYDIGRGFLFTMESENQPLDTDYLEHMLRTRFPHI